MVVLMTLLTHKERDLSFDNKCIFKAIRKYLEREFISLPPHIVF